MKNRSMHLMFMATCCLSAMVFGSQRNTNTDWSDDEVMSEAVKAAYFGEVSPVLSDDVVPAKHVDPFAQIVIKSPTLLLVQSRIAKDISRARQFQVKTPESDAADVDMLDLEYSGAGFDATNQAGHVHQQKPSFRSVSRNDTSPVDQEEAVILVHRPRASLLRSRLCGHVQQGVLLEPTEDVSPNISPVSFVSE